METRKQYTKEFKLDAISLIVDQGLTIAEAARNLEIRDNAVAKSFFGSLKQERCQWRHYQTRYEAQQDILQYIAVFYNNQRLHSYLDYKSPNQYEAEATKTMKVA